MTAWDRFWSEFWEAIRWMASAFNGPEPTESELLQAELNALLREKWRRETRAQIAELKRELDGEAP